MATYVLIHGAGDVAWYWHLVEVELREHGHDVVAVDLPCEACLHGAQYVGEQADGRGQPR